MTLNEFNWASHLKPLYSLINYCGWLSCVHRIQAFGRPKRKTIKIVMILEDIYFFFSNILISFKLIEYAIESSY